MSTIWISGGEPAVRKAVEAIADRSLLPVMIGGEHTVSVAAVAAMAQEVEDLAVVQLDAHADMRSRYGGSRSSHACVMRRIAEKTGLPVLPVGRVFRLGLRWQLPGEIRVEVDGQTHAVVPFDIPLRSTPDRLQFRPTASGCQLYLHADGATSLSF